MADVKAQYSQEFNRLRATNYFLVQEKQQLSSKLIGVGVLADQLDRKEEECRILKFKVQEFEVLLSRAENRIAQLTQQNGKGPQKGVLTPGVSKKLLDTLTRENTKLKLSLEHILNKNPKGIDLAVENHDLHDMVIAQKDELEQVRKETEELRSALRAVEMDDHSQLQEQVARLTAEQTNTERSLKAKQVYCETVVNENERLKSTVEAVKSERVTQLAILKKLANDYPVIKDVIDRAWCGPEDNVDGQSAQNKAEITKYTKKIEELQQQLEETQKKRDLLEDKVQELMEMNTIIQEKMHQLDAQSKAMLDNFIDENEKLKDEMREMGASFEEANMVKGLMEEQCNTYENDFKAEQKEKEKLTGEVKALLKKVQETTEENKRLKFEMDKINSYFKAELERRQQQYKQPQPAPRQKPPSHQYSQPRPTAGKSPSPPPQEPWKVSQAAGVYKPGPAHYNSPIPPPQEPWKASHSAGGYKTPHFNTQFSGVVCSDGPSDSPRQGCLNCPICRREVPYEQMEEHINDCNRMP